MISEMNLFGRLKRSFFQVKLDNYGFYIGKAEAGGGVIGYVDGQLVYLHQGC